MLADLGPRLGSKLKLRIVYRQPEKAIGSASKSICGNNVTNWLRNPVKSIVCKHASRWLLGLA